MVSRYLVDGVVIAGLFAGALGVFLLAPGFGLSLGVFGRYGRLLAPLVPSSVVIIVCVTLGQLWTIALGGICTFGPCPAAPAGYPIDFGGYAWLVIGVVFLALVYVVAFNAALYFFSALIVFGSGSSFEVYRVVRWLVILMAAVSLVAVPVYALLSHDQISLGVVLIPAYLVFLVLVDVTLLTPFLASRDSDVRVKVTGLILTLAGIATQFVPPVLDRLNIPVR